jgi:hypothetical protein
MSRLSAAIDVATEYAWHLHTTDGVPAPQAIQIGVAAVVRAARSNPARFVTPRQPVESGVGWSGQALSLVGSSLSVIGLLKTIFGGG